LTVPRGIRESQELLGISGQILATGQAKEAFGLTVFFLVWPQNGRLAGATFAFAHNGRLAGATFGPER
jgi:hypothetical protein